MKNKLLIATSSLFVFAVLLHNFEKPVLAQIRAALTKNIDERGRSPYTVQGSCGGIAKNFFQAAIPAVPANKRFVVEYINGTVLGYRGPDFVDAVFNVPSVKPSGTLSHNYPHQHSPGIEYSQSLLRIRHKHARRALLRRWSKPICCDRKRIF